MAHPVNLLYVVALLNVCLALFALVRSRSRVAQLFALMMLLACTWALSYHQELTAKGLDQKIFWVQFKYLFLVFLIPAFLALIQQFTGRWRWLRGWVWGALLAYPVLTIPVVLTMRHHQWFRYGFRIERAMGLEVLAFQWGPWGQILVVLGNCFGLGALVMLASAWWGAPPIMRKQLGLMFLTYLVPAGLDVVFLVGLNPIRVVNFSQFALLVTASIWAWLLFGYRTLNLVPLARGAVLDNLPSVVFVVDPAGRLVDVNRTMMQKFGLERAQVVGKFAAEVLPQFWRPLLDPVAGSARVIRLGEGAGALWYERTITSLQDPSGGPDGGSLGTLFTCQDVTDRLRAETARDENKALLDLIVNNISEAVLLIDENGAIVALNDPTLKIYGVTREQAFASGMVEELLQPEPQGGPPRSWQTIQPGDVLDFQRRVRRPLTGEEFDAHVFLRGTVRDGGKLVVATVRDISDRLRQELVRREAVRLEAERRHLRQQELLLRDLHDGIGGITASIGAMAAVGARARRCAAEDCPLSRIALLAAEGSSEIRSLMNSMESGDLRWPELLVEMRRFGVMLLDDQRVEFTLVVSGEPPELGPGLVPGMSVFKVFREAVNNVARHAGASRVEVRVAFFDDRVELAVHDDGRGLPVPIRQGRGLENMRRRVEELGGEMRIQDGKGLELAFTLPIPMRVSADQGHEQLGQARSPAVRMAL